MDVKKCVRFLTFYILELILIYNTTRINGFGIINAESLMRRAEMYQDYMKEIQIPANRGSVIPFNTWQELAKSMKQLYKQPLHYLTNVQMKQWDKARLDTEQEQVPMDNFVHPAKAEATVWLIEEIHRQNTSHLFLAKVWSNEPLYHAFVDPFSISTT